MLTLRSIFLYTFFLLSIFLVLFPEFDIKFSSLFFDPDLGFKYKNNIVAVGIFKFIPKLSSIWVLGLVIHIAYNVASKMSLKSVLKLPTLFLLISTLIGPGLCVNYVLKENWGRARPNVIEQFGGDKQFARAGAISDQCTSNCSFSSGHAAMGYYFTSLSWIVPFHLQNIVFIATFLFGSFVGLGRIAQGGHFLSDITFSFLIIMLVNQASYAFWIYIKRKYTTKDD